MAGGATGVVQALSALEPPPPHAERLATLSSSNEICCRRELFFCNIEEKAMRNEWHSLKH